MILEKIAAQTALRYQKRKEIIPPAQMQEMAEQMVKKRDFPFAKALRKEGITFICEVKQASPSKKRIAETFPYCSIAQEYETAGAGCVSVLTEPNWFLGDDRYLREIAGAVSIPVLRKDFTIDEYQIYEAKTLGAHGVLLICALLDTRTLAQYLDIAHGLGLSAIVEAHTAAETDSAVAAGAEIIGINNRNLKTFAVDLDTSVHLRDRVPPDRLFVSESGIRTAEDVAALRKIGADGVLIGETLMRSPNKTQTLRAFRGTEV